MYESTKTTLQQLCSLRGEVRKSKPFKGKAELLRKIGKQVRFLGQYKHDASLAERFLGESREIFLTRPTTEGQEQIGMF